MKNLAILDIDGSYTNEQDFGIAQFERNAMIVLNQLKNKRIEKYDYAFKDMAVGDQEDEEYFIREVRLTFFNLLKIYLSPIVECIDKTKDKNDANTVFSKYFNKEKYLSNFDIDTKST